MENDRSSLTLAFFSYTCTKILDAAKSNRCTSLFRQQPDETEMITIVSGVLYCSKDDGRAISMIKFCDMVVELKDFSKALCDAYSSIVSGRIDSDFETFFGLRDFIYFLKDLRQNCHITSNMVMILTLKDIVRGLERNFNGIGDSLFEHLVNIFTGSLPMIQKRDNVSQLIKPQIEVVREVLMETQSCSDSRYKLIIDESEDDSVMRLLSEEGLIMMSPECLFKLSNMSENAELERLMLVSGVKFAAQQGVTAVLSQMDAVHSCFFDLFNQRFKKVCLVVIPDSSCYKLFIHV